MSNPVAPVGTTARALPARNGDNAESLVRHWTYGEVATIPLMGSKMHALADQGSYFVATNATPGTAISSVAAESTFSDLKALLFLRHGASSNKRLYLDYIKLTVAAAGTNGTNWAFEMKGDKGTSRYASGGTAITPKNPNMASSATSEIDAMYFGAVVPVAATSDARLLHHGLVRTVIKVIGDQYLFTFGNSSPSSQATTIMEGTAQAALNIPCPPVILGAGDTFLLKEAAASQDTAAQYQFTMGWWEA